MRKIWRSSGARRRPPLSFKLCAIGFHLRVSELDAQALAYGGFYGQALKLH